MIGIAILSLITIAGIWLEKNVSSKIPAIIYISIIGIVLAFPGMPTASMISHYVSNIEMLSICTALLAYVGIGMGKNWNEFKSLGGKSVIITLLVIESTYLGSAFVANILLTIA